MINERKIAFESLCKVIIDKQYSNIVLRKNKDNSAFVTQLVYGTLRNYRLLREGWSKYCTNKPHNKIAILLDMACYELFFLNKKEYATINEIVQISKEINHGIFSGFVNAILRKVKKEDFISEDVTLATSHPKWLADLWTNHYGKEVANKIMLEDNKEPRISLRVNTLMTNKEELLKDNRFSEGSIEDCLYYDGNIIESEYFQKNLVIIQSESSIQAVNSLAVKDNMKVLDLCAAPGSKTVQIAMAMHNTGLVVANDIYDFRCQLIKDNVKKYQLNNVTVVNFDGLQIDKHLQMESFDAVLLDAPCSGLGTLKHKPEIKMNIKPEDLDDIVNLQAELLVTASKMIKKGGSIVYSTCTLNKKENERQLERFVKENPNFSLEKMETIFPYQFSSDGFFIGRLIRND